MTVGEYLNAAPKPQRSTLLQLRGTLRNILPDATEMLSYGVPTFRVGKSAVAGYAYFKNHCSYFPHSGSVLSELADELEAYQWSKGTLRFPIGESLPQPLVQRLVAVRLEQLGLG